MVNSWYDQGLETFAAGDTAWDTSNIIVLCIDEADDTIDLVNDDFLNDRAAASRVATSGNLASKTQTDGYLDAADVTLTSVTGDPFESVDVVHNTGTETTSPFLLNFDTATGLPLTPDGGNVTIQWDNGTNRIARL